MDKYKLDFNEYKKYLQPETKVSLASVKSDIEKVGFGIVRYDNPQYKESLWEIKDGHIYALYENENIEKQSDWETVTDKTGKYATIFYKRTAIKNIKFAELNIDETEIKSFTKVLPQRLANNKELVKKMLDTIDESYKQKVLELHPELT